MGDRLGARDRRPVRRRALSLAESWRGESRTHSKDEMRVLLVRCAIRCSVVTSVRYNLDIRGVHRVHIYSATRPLEPPILIAADLYSSAPHGGGGFGIDLAAGVWVVALRVRTVVQRTIAFRLTEAPAECTAGTCAPWFGEV